MISEILHKIENLENQMEWIEIYQIVDSLDQSHYKVFFDRFSEMNIMNLCEFIFRKKNKCEKSYDICYNLLSPIQDLLTKEWVDYCFNTHFLKLPSNDIELLYQIFKKNCLNNELIYSSFTKYFIINKYYDWANINSFDLKCLQDESLMSVFFENIYVDYDSLPVDLKLKYFSQNENFKEFISCIQKNGANFLEDLSEDSKDVENLLNQVFLKDPFFFFDHILLFTEYTGFITNVLLHFSKDISMKFNIKKLFYNAAQCRNVSFMKLIFELCRNSIFLFDYVRDKYSSLDIILELFQSVIQNIYKENIYFFENKLYMNNLFIKDLNCSLYDFYYIFDNYCDSQSLYPVQATETFQNLLNARYLFVDELVIYFIENYDHNVSFFVKNNVSKLFKEQIQHILFDKYPELLFHEKFSQCQPYESENKLVEIKKIERVCKLLYIPVDFVKFIKMTHKDYLEICIKHNI